MLKGVLSCKLKAKKENGKFHNYVIRLCGDSPESSDTGKLIQPCEAIQS